MLAANGRPSTDFIWLVVRLYGQRFTGSADMLMGFLNKNGAPVTVGSCAPGNLSFLAGNLKHQATRFISGVCIPRAHFVFADGSVRFLDYSAAPIMLLSRRAAGGEPWMCMTEARGNARFDHRNNPLDSYHVHSFASCCSRLQRRAFAAAGYLYYIGDDAPGAVIDQTEREFPDWPLAEHRVLHVRNPTQHAVRSRRRGLLLRGQLQLSV